MTDFSHRLPIDRIRDGDRIELDADEPARRAIADRLGLISLDRLEAHVALTRDGAAVRACGRVKAALSQACVATGEPVAAHIDEPFELNFVPEPKADRADEEVELGSRDLDTVFHDGAGIELGAAIVDSLALALDPYPRSAEADAALRQAGVMREEEASPFAMLAALKGKMAGE